MKTKVEIISATECKTINPFGKRPYMNEDRFTSMPFAFYTWSLNNWQTAENEREVYRIEQVFYENLLEIGIDVSFNYDPKSDILKLGSIHEAELNKETKTAIVL